MFCLKNIWADRKVYRFKISGPRLRFVVIYMRPVREFPVSVRQQPTRSQTGLSLLSGRKKCLAADRYELMPV